MEYHNYLQKIVKNKEKQIDDLIRLTRAQEDHPLNAILNKAAKPSTSRFFKALQRDGLQVIAEVKRKSPALGKLNTINNPVDLALNYCKGGAAAISVLTDAEAFGGSLEDLTQISNAVADHQPIIPILRKDFILHPLQLAESITIGCDAVLLIVALLGNKLTFLMQEAKRLGLETLVEVHDIQELEIALEAGADIIGVNHRNLKTFETDLTLSEKLVAHIPPSKVKVAESGIHTPEQARCMAERGFDAILVGEALVRSATPDVLIRQMREEHDH